MTFLQPINQQNIKEFYTFHKELGRGASGICYHATSISDPSKDYCVKKIKKDANDELNKAKREITFLDKISHPDIIRLHEIYETSSSYFIVLDFCEGGELFDYLAEKGTLSEDQAKQIFSQMVSSVNYCHSMKIAHRDLKPQNFLLMNSPSEAGSPNVKLIDFDLAFQWQDNMSREVKQKQGHRIIGSPYYIAPEIIEGNYDKRCDIWSLGVILYMLVSGVPPFDGQTNHEIVSNIKKKKYSLYIPEMQNVSLLLKDLIKKILQDQEQRITIEGIFNHPWMKIKPKKTQMNIEFSNLLKFSKLSKLKEIAATYIASQMTAKETKNLQNLFRQIDKNRDGFLSCEELKDAFKDSSKKSKEELENLLNFVKTSKNGLLNYNEFIASTISEKVIESKENIRSVFNMIDKDGNGYVDKEEINFILEKYEIKRKGPHDITNQVDEIFKKSDKNNDGKIDFEEFVDTLCSNLI